MSSYGVKNIADLKHLVRTLEKRAMPYTVNVTRGLPRTNEQNKLQWKWMQELEEQGDMTAEEYRGYCKLHFGIPILREASEAYRESYDRIIRPLKYADKMELMMMPHDYPVTRLMTTKQKTRYLDAVFTHFLSEGFKLTLPENEDERPARRDGAALVETQGDSARPI